MGLKLTQLDGQWIVLTGMLKEGDEISIQVTNIRGGRIGVYTEAPPSINISRRD